ncbi:MAG: histidine kinase [Sphingobacteriaceae bacterium]|nr:histidine kinase [Sphingobacteriaceae bacterium]
MFAASKIYWICQLLGWSLYVFINLIFFGLKNEATTFKEFTIYLLQLPIGIGLTHLYRQLLLHYNIQEKKFPAQLVFVLICSLIMGITFFFHTTGLLIYFKVILTDLSSFYIFQITSNYTLVFCLWSAIYFGFKYFQNYKKVEIDSLRYAAANKESELSSLKAQLNPHFMFNSMNSIRALIDENPVKAKSAVTQLSGILRNTLLLNKSKVIPLSEELELVQEYLKMEKIRYEERLNFEFKIEKEVLHSLIPPFIIQSQVENAIKHGISKLPGNGNIIIEAFKLGEFLKIKVSNTGKISTEKPLTGVGFQNSIQRLQLLFGIEGQIFISELNNLVVVDINIPLK